MDDSDSDEVEEGEGAVGVEESLPSLEDPDFAQFVSYLGCADIVSDKEPPEQYEDEQQQSSSSRDENINYK